MKMTKTANGQDATVISPSSLLSRAPTLKLQLQAAAIIKLRREGRPLPDGPLDPLAILSEDEIARILSEAGIDD
jgi:hypothetical protein